MRKNVVISAVSLIIGFLLALFTFNNSGDLKQELADIQKQRDSLAVLRKISLSKQRILSDSVRLYKARDSAKAAAIQSQKQEIKSFKSRESKREAEIAKIASLSNQSVDSAYEARYSVRFSVAKKYGLQDLIRFDTLKVYTGLLETHIDSLDLQVKTQYHIIRNQDKLILEKDNFTELVLKEQVLDQQTISVLKKEVRKHKRNGLKKAVGGAVVGITVFSLISQF